MAPNRGSRTYLVILLEAVSAGPMAI
jgi:hypothetical protein